MARKYPSRTSRYAPKKPKTGMALKDCGPGMIYDWRRGRCIPIVKGDKLAGTK